MPQPLSLPRPRILAAGSGERKTLRLAARYGDACNVAGDPDTVRRKLDVLRGHCEEEGRSYDEILKTAIFPMNIGRDGSAAAQLVDQLGRYAEAGCQMVIGSLAAVDQIRPIEIMGRDVIPQVASL